MQNGVSAADRLLPGHLHRGADLCPGNVSPQQVKACAGRDGALDTEENYHLLLNHSPPNSS